MTHHQRNEILSDCVQVTASLLQLLLLQETYEGTGNLQSGSKAVPSLYEKCDGDYLIYPEDSNKTVLLYLNFNLTLT